MARTITVVNIAHDGMLAVLIECVVGITTQWLVIMAVFQTTC
jgi:hypothetical protein